MDVIDLPGVCKYNVGVTCYLKDTCWKCAWNPKIDKKRREKTREKWLAEEAKKKNV